ncbi:MAG: hypothetical protein HPKKFMNG_02345 [Planctomycetes bacterium]|nr:hypothetical protein [Planctomycetota bacterium]
MFGLGPRTIWNKGLELELEQEFDWAFRYFSGDNPDSNPRDRRMFMHTIEPGITYGFSRDFAMRVKTPYFYMREHTKDGSEVYAGARKFSVAGTYRFLNNVFEGGSTKASWFASIELPTATRRHGKPMGDEFDDNWTFTFGLSASTSTTRHYLWFDLAGRGSTQIDGSGAGPEAQAHLAYAYRVFQLTDYRDFDLILLVEADARFEHRGRMHGDRDDNSGGYFVHLALGMQMNITNRIECKLGLNLPVYRYLFGKQFYHEGEFMLMFSYLI